VFVSGDSESSSRERESQEPHVAIHLCAFASVSVSLPPYLRLCVFACLCVCVCGPELSTLAAEFSVSASVSCQTCWKKVGVTAFRCAQCFLCVFVPFAPVIAVCSLLFMFNGLASNWIMFETVDYEPDSLSLCVYVFVSA